ncbi:MAG: hypothetical protein R6V28_05135 [Nitriliruptoraceae bacterium]
MTHDDPWFARQQAERAWRRYAEEGATEGVRDEVGRSWERSAAHLPPDRGQAPLVAEDRARERWQHSPVRAAVAALREELDRVVADGGFVAAVTGADGTILWTQGSSWMRDRAATVHFVPGGRWDEASIGTNALALALRTNTASQVFSAEHYSTAIHDWVCYSAPIQDLRSGRVLGVLDLSTTWERAQPLGLTAAKLLASNLSLLLPATTAATEAVDGLDLRVLGHPEVRLHGRPVDLPRRQLELLTVLSLHPEGMNLQALHAALHPDHTVQPATVKAEVSHLRRALGAAVIASRPYRLTVPINADHLDVLEDIAAGRLGRAVSTYAGPLLAGTEAPALREHATYLEVALRRAVLTADDPDLLFALGARLPQEIEVHERTLARLPDRDPRAAIAHARLRAALA